MGCGDACPVDPGKRYVEWALDDPAGAAIDTVRRVRDEIRGLVEELLIELGVTATSPGDRRKRNVETRRTSAT